MTLSAALNALNSSSPSPLPTLLRHDVLRSLTGLVGVKHFDSAECCLSPNSEAHFFGSGSPLRCSSYTWAARRRRIIVSNKSSHSSLLRYFRSSTHLTPLSINVDSMPSFHPRPYEESQSLTFSIGDGFDMVVLCA